MKPDLTQIAMDEDAMRGIVRGRSCIGYRVVARDVDLMQPIVVLKIDHTAREVHVGREVGR